MRNGPYELIVAPEGYPGKRYRDRYAYEHHVVWWQETGELPEKGWAIHHINGDHRDNRRENLTLVTVQEHTRIHNALKGGQTYFQLRCPTCGKEFQLSAQRYSSRSTENCSHSCASKAAHLRKANSVPIV